MSVARPSGTAQRSCASPSTSSGRRRTRLCGLAAHGDDLAPYYVEAERLLGVRTFPCEPDLTRILAQLAYRGSPWRTQPIPLALAADIRAHPLRPHISTALPRRATSRARPSVVPCAVARPSIHPARQRRSHRAAGLSYSPRMISGVRLADGRELHASV